jgi:triacylglycerol esterase/lipase EstA (alpha/beta hydrolase family)
MVTSHPTRTLALLAGALLAVLALVAGPAVAAPATPAAAFPAGPYAPLDRPGPALDVPAALLAASLTCSPGVAGAGRAPVLLVHGTALDAAVNWSWTYEPDLTAAGIPWCAVNLPGDGLGDVATAGEYVVHAIRTMYAEAGRRIDIIGYSQGGMVPRWALRFWPDTRAMVDQFVAIDPSNHGTLDAVGLCLPGCAPSIWQQRTGSAFLAALNSGAETFAGITYTVVYSLEDEVVVPNLGPEGSSALHTGAGTITNLAVQQLCPGHVADHITMGTIDPVAYSVALHAVAGTPVGDPCTALFLPGLTAGSVAGHEAAVATTIATSLATYPHTATEPALPSYVFG